MPAAGSDDILMVQPTALAMLRRRKFGISPPFYHARLSWSGWRCFRGMEGPKNCFYTRGCQLENGGLCIVLEEESSKVESSPSRPLQCGLKQEQFITCPGEEEERK